MWCVCSQDKMSTACSRLNSLCVQFYKYTWALNMSCMFVVVAGVMGQLTGWIKRCNRHMTIDSIGHGGKCPPPQLLQMAAWNWAPWVEEEQTRNWQNYSDLLTITKALTKTTNVFVEPKKWRVRPKIRSRRVHSPLWTFFPTPLRKCLRHAVKLIAEWDVIDFQLAV